MVLTIIEWGESLCVLLYQVNAIKRFMPASLYGVNFNEYHVKTAYPSLLLLATMERQTGMQSAFITERQYKDEPNKFT